MDVGMILPRIDVGGRPLTGAHFTDSMVRIEGMGFDSIWITDNMNRGFANPDPLITLGVAAATTHRVRLGTSILQVGIRNPYELANRVMLTHLLAGDRLRLGVGAGSTRADFAATGYSFDDRYARFTVAIEHMRRLWRGETVDGACLYPFEATLGGPPLLLGSWSARGITAVAHDFDGWIGSARKTSWSVIRTAIRRFRDAGGTWAAITNVVINPGGSEEPDDADTPLAPCGLGVARVRLETFRELGFDEVILRTADHTDEVLAAIRDILPS